MTASDDEKASHDPLCSHADPEYFPTVMFGGEPFPCDCDLIRRVVKRERGRHDHDCPPPGAIRREERDAIAAAVMNLPDAHRRKSKMGGKGYGKWGGDGSIWRMDVLKLTDQGGSNEELSTRSD